MILLYLQTLDEVHSINVLHSVVFMLEAREEPIPRLQSSQIAEIHTISRSRVLARHEQWNARRIRYDTARDDTVRHVYDRAEFEKAWMTATGGIVYVIHPASVPLPASPGNW